jgi:hypothetical protein
MSKNFVDLEGPQITIQYGVACWICEATREHAYAYTHAPGNLHRGKCVTCFPRQKWFANAPQCYVIRTLPVLFLLQNVWTASGLTQLCLGVPGFFPGASGWQLLSIVCRLQLWTASSPPLPPYAFMTWAGTPLPLHLILLQLNECLLMATQPLGCVL